MQMIENVQESARLRLGNSPPGYAGQVDYCSMLVI